MIISPSLLHEHSDTEKDADWVNRMMPVDPQRNFPVNTGRSWHGGIHLSSNSSDSIRCIADGKVISLRQPDSAKSNIPPLNYNGTTDCGYVLLKHETEIGSGDEGKIVYYSLYMHLSNIDNGVQPGKLMYRKDVIGTAGMVDNQHAIHFQIFCDDDNIVKITGRRTPELSLAENGRTDVVYGDIHFYVPMGAAVYEIMPDGGSLATNGPVKYTNIDLFVTMSFDKGSCTMVTRKADSHYSAIGEPLVNVDGTDYEYNLYTYAKSFYPLSPSAGYELLRFGRVINTEYEVLSPVDAPLWRTINVPDGKGVVNLADRNVKVFSDGDFPHWTGWRLVDDDTDSNSQCNSPTILCTLDSDLSRMICHFPLEWDEGTVDSRFEWLKSPNNVLSEPMTECDLNLLTDHGKALCLAENPLPSGRMWHFEPRQFISHFRKCGWLSLDELTSTFPKYMFYTENGSPRTAITSTGDIYTLRKNIAQDRIKEYSIFLNKCILKYIGADKKRISIFLSQVLLETAQWRNLGGMRRLMHEWHYGQYNGNNPNTLYYTAFYGRGIMQLTWAGNYKIYGEYKVLPSNNKGYEERLTPGHPRITRTSMHYTAKPDDGGVKIRWFPRYDPDLIGEDKYLSCDSGGFYWVSKEHAEGLCINRISDRNTDIKNFADDVGKVNKLVNGGGNGYYERQAYTYYMLRFLTDDVDISTTITISPTGKSIILANMEKPN
ncbi:TPA: hypothetical protein N2G30_001640 [Salmonella enterica]|nr:hypothetical protein [Salmonella enterica]